MKDKVFVCPMCGKILAQIHNGVFSCKGISTKGSKIVCPDCGFVTNYDIVEITKGAICIINGKDITIEHLEIH